MNFLFQVFSAVAESQNLINGKKEIKTGQLFIHGTAEENNKWEADLFGGSLASSMPVPVIVNVSQSGPFVHRVEGEEMNFSDTSSCLIVKYI